MTALSGAYYGLDNTNFSSRFGFLGSARVNPSVTMGFEIMIDIGTARRHDLERQPARRGWQARRPRPDGQQRSPQPANSGSDQSF